MTPSGADRRTRVAYVIGTLDRGGAEGQLVALASGLDRQRFEPAVYCLSASGALAPDLVGGGVPVRSFGLRGLRLWRNPVAVARALRGLVGALRRDRPDLVHGLLFHGYVFGAVAGRLAGIPVVVASRRSLSHFKRGKPHYRLAERVANRLTDLVIANSEAVRADVLRSEGLAPERVVVIHNGVPVERFDRPRDEELRRRLAIDKASRVVVVVANFLLYKGHEVFLDAWARVVARAPDAVALLVGDGPARGEIEARAAAAGLTGSLRFLGSRLDVPDVLALADVLVHPSFEEGFCNAILEAMAAGKPVVATDVGGNPEAVVPGTTGLLVPAGDGAALAQALTSLLDRPEQLQALGRAGRCRVAEQFGLSVMVRRYESVYDRLLADARARRARSNRP
jgi:glycosyltransferase involved in cell wall biosynthesis